MSVRRRKRILKSNLDSLDDDDVLLKSKVPSHPELERRLREFNRELKAENERKIALIAKWDTEDRAKEQELKRKAGKNRPVVFARIGWMPKYAGPTADDQGPVGGGAYNDTSIGDEVCNFTKRGQWLYGYFETARTTARTRDDAGVLTLERIDPAAKGKEKLEDVLVILVSRHEHRGQVVIGWYRHATVLREAQMRPAPDHKYSYRCKSKVADSVLLPPSRREFPIPSGKGTIGRSNVRYMLDRSSSPDPATWMVRAIRYVDSYNGPNYLLSDVDEDASADAAESELRRGQGRWVGADGKEKKALEDYAVDWAVEYFKKKGYKAEKVGDRECYDVCCTKNGRTLCVEVKATTTGGEKVILTFNEANLKADRALFVVHSVQMKRGKPKGGKYRVIHPWTLASKHLKPISYVYTLPRPLR